MARHQFCWIEFQSTDIERTKTFLSGLFEDWTWESWGEMKMYMFQPPDEGLGGGVFLVDSVGPGNSPAVYIHVEEIDDTLAKARELGGTIVAEKSPIPGMGWSAQFSDPDGNRIGLYQANPQS